MAAKTCGISKAARRAIPPCATTSAQFFSWPAERAQRALAAASGSPSCCDVSSLTSAGMVPASAIALWLAGCPLESHASAVHASERSCGVAAVVPPTITFTIGARPPARLTAARCSAERLAMRRRTATACSLAFILPLEATSTIGRMPPSVTTASARFLLRSTSRCSSKRGPSRSSVREVSTIARTTILARRMSVSCCSARSPSVRARSPIVSWRGARSLTGRTSASPATSRRERRAPSVSVVPRCQRLPLCCSGCCCCCWYPVSTSSATLRRMVSVNVPSLLLFLEDATASMSGTSK